MARILHARVAEQEVGMQLLIVADAARARFYEMDDEITHLDEVCDLVHPEARLRAADVYEGNLGRKSGASMTHGDPKDIEGERFAREVAQEMEKRVAGCERVHLAAPPKFLGQLRAVISGNVEKKLASTLAKDLTKLSVHELKKVLSA